VLPNDRFSRLRSHVTSSDERYEMKDTSGVKDIDYVYVGHIFLNERPVATPVPYALGNVRYIDTGCGKGGSLTLLNLTELH